MYINTPNFSSFPISGCVFTKCKASYGGALCLGQDNSYIHIDNTRFDENKAQHEGDDIDVFYHICFDNITDGSFASSVCSTSSPSNNRVYCTENGENQLQNNCSEQVV
jgi:hypothetical protein